MKTTSSNKKDNYKNHLYALIVAGGGGTRLWPKSLNSNPKQFLGLFGKKNLMQITAHRFAKILPWEKIFVVTVSDEYKKKVLKFVPELLAKNVIVEPLRRNTAPAHGIGAAYIYKEDKDAVIMNEAADHLVDPEHLYFKSFYAAAAAAYGGDYIVTIGIKPTYPGIGYGHIKKSEKFGVFNGENVYKFGKFIEKPDLKAAKRFNASGNYYWNANQYVWRADTFLKALRIHEHSAGRAITAISEAIGTKDEKKVLLREYKKIPELTAEGKPMSIDYAVSEKAKNILLVVAEYHWTDIGDWKEVWENLPKDENDNVIIDGEEPGGKVYNIDTSDALIHTNGRPIAIIDVDNVVVVDTKDALLICSKSRAQNVKKIVQILKKEGRKELL